MKYQVLLKSADWEAFQTYTARKLMLDKQNVTGAFFGAIVLWAFLAAAFLAAVDRVELDSATALVVTFAFAMIVATYWLQGRRIRRLYRPQERDDGVWKIMTYTFAEDGWDAEYEYARTRYAWQAITEVAETRDHLFIYLDNIMGQILPKAQIEDSAALLQLIREKIGDEKITNAQSGWSSG